MNGPQHYREAEQLLVRLATEGETLYPGLRDALAVRAQGHALLALAAATGGLDLGTTRWGTDREAWARIVQAPEGATGA